jgi:transcriptional regulator with XRE-family HTH domain
LDSTYNLSYDQFIRRLVDARKAAGITQEQLALRLKKPQSYVSKVETRERRLDVIEYLYWSKALDVDPETLLKGIVSGIGRRRSTNLE